MEIRDKQGRLLATHREVSQPFVYKLSKKTPLHNANLAGADMRYLSARSVDFRNSDFSNADFMQADLSRADLRGVNFRGANLVYCRMREAIFDDTCILHWRSHDLLSAVLRHVAKTQYDADGDMTMFIRHGILAGLPHMFREWCWPEYNRYLPKEDAEWMCEALCPWVVSDPQRNEYVPQELLRGLRYGR